MQEKLTPYQEEQEMSFLDHLEALRWHLVRSTIAVVILGIVAFLNKELVFDEFIFAPKKSDFITFKLFCKLSEYLHLKVPFLVPNKDLICIGQNLPQLQNISMAGQFMSHMMIAFVIGIIVAFPYIVWEFWRFLKPGLTKKEVNSARGLVFFTSILFISGVAFGYFLIAPLSINFFMNYQVSSEVANLPTLDAYISTITTLLLGCGAVFELPILIYFLTKVGVVNAQFLKTYRKHAFVVTLIVAAVITPPDVFSQMLVTIPLTFLYEISIFISKITEKKQEI